MRMLWRDDDSFPTVDAARFPHGKARFPDSGCSKVPDTGCSKVPDWWMQQRLPNGLRSSGCKLMETTAAYGRWMQQCFPGGIHSSDIHVVDAVHPNGIIRFVNEYPDLGVS